MFKCVLFLFFYGISCQATENTLPYFFHQMTYFNVDWLHMGY